MESTEATPRGNYMVMYFQGTLEGIVDDHDSLHARLIALSLGQSCDAFVMKLCGCSAQRLLAFQGRAGQ